MRSATDYTYTNKSSGRQRSFAPKPDEMMVTFHGLEQLAVAELQSTGGSSMQSANAATEQQLDLWVDAATGSDSNSGAANFPLRTISAAVYKIPLWVRHPVTVHVHRGTYAERLDLQFMMMAEGSVTFIGEDWRAHSPRQGIRSGKFDRSFGAQRIPNAATCSAGGWSVDELKGTFVRITSGADTGAYLPWRGIRRRLLISACLQIGVLLAGGISEGRSSN